MGYSLGQDAQSPSRPAPLRQDGSTPDDLGTGAPVCPTEVTTLDHERNSLNENLQSTLLHSPSDGIPHEGTSSVPQPTSQPNLEQNDGIIDEATSLSSNTLQRQGFPSPGPQATLVSSTHASPVANVNFSAFADPFPSSDFPHGIFNDLPNLPEADQASFLADPFPASDFPHGIFNNLPNLPEADQASFLADPFPASDFPHGIFNNLPNLPEADQASFLADPFPASDFPHGIFNALPGLPLTSLSSSGSLPAADISGTPKGSSANFVITREPEGCSTNSVAPSGSLRESFVIVPF